MNSKLVIALVTLLLAAVGVYAFTRKKGWSITSGLLHPVIGTKEPTLLYSSPEASNYFAMAYPANSYIGDADDLEKVKMNAQGLNGWTPIVPTMPFDKGDYLYVQDGDIAMATRSLDTYNITPTNDNYS